MSAKAIDWWRRYRALPRRVRIAAAGYLVLAIFGASAGLARLGGAGPDSALIIGALAAAPALLAMMGERITGIKALSVEISLSQVAVPVEGDLTRAVMAIAETGPSASLDLLNSFVAAMRARWRVLRVNLRDDNYWWSTRVFLVAALAVDYTDVEAIVFVRSGEQRVFLGIATPGAVRARLGSVFPSYEVAYRKVRAEAVSAFEPPNRDRELNEILMWRWTGALKPPEPEARIIVTSQSLMEWLQADLDTESLPYGPLGPILRYRICTRSQRYSALTNASQLVAIVDRDEVAVRTMVAELEQRFG
jgi:hypothetical protein